MNKEDILSSARKEGDRGYEYETKSSVKSILWASLISLIMGMVLFGLEYFIKGSANVGLIAVGLTALGTQSLFEGIKVRKIYMIVIGIVFLIIAFGAVLVFVKRLVV